MGSNRGFTSYYINLFTKGAYIMLKFLARLAEKYSKSANTACVFLGFIHQPKMTASMIKKD